MYEEDKLMARPKTYVSMCEEDKRKANSPLRRSYNGAQQHAEDLRLNV